MTDTNNAQRESVDRVVAAIRRNGFVAVVKEDTNGTVQVRREGATSCAVVGRRGGIRWQ